MKIRIGNDVQLRINLSLGDGVDNTNIQSARVIFVNSNLTDSRFIGRFPIEPFEDEFIPNSYCINSLGNPKYYAKVRNRYNGFGVYPDWNKCLPIEQPFAPEHQSDIIGTGDSPSVTAVFPAIKQRRVGIYNVIVIVNIYDQDYPRGIRTMTIDIKNVFELVRTTEEADINGPAQIEVDDHSINGDVSDVFIVSGSYSNNGIRLRRNDNGVVSIDVSPISGWYEGD